MAGKTLEAVMTLPKGGKQRMTRMMQAEIADEPYEAPAEIPVGTPLAIYRAAFPDGVTVAMGVRKGNSSDYNTIYAWVFDKDGLRFPGFPIDLSDHEDFGVSEIEFGVCEGEVEDEDVYRLLVKEE